MLVIFWFCVGSGSGCDIVSIGYPYGIDTVFSSGNLVLIGYLSSTHFLMTSDSNSSVLML